jgi:hypothetical protein
VAAAVVKAVALLGSMNQDVISLTIVGNEKWYANFDVHLGLDLIIVS